MLYKKVHIVHMDHAIARNHRHIWIDLGNNTFSRLGRGEGDIHGYPQIEPPEGIRRRYLNEGIVNGHVAFQKEIRYGINIHGGQETSGSR